MRKRPGYIAISRKAYESDVWWNEPRVFSKWEAWEDLLQSAAWRDGTRREMPNGSVVLERGEVVISRRILAARWKWTEKAVRTFLAEATERARIKARSEARTGTVYLIVKYDAYQNGNGETGPAKGPKVGPEALGVIGDDTDVARRALESARNSAGPAKGPQKGPDRTRGTEVAATTSVAPPNAQGPQSGRQKGPLFYSEVETSNKHPAGWVAEFGQMWADVRRAVANYGRIGKALKPLVERDGTEAVRLAWAQFVSSPSAKYGPEWFAENAGDFRPVEQSRPILTAAGNPILSIDEYREQQRRDLEEINKLRVARGEAPIAVA